MSDSHSEFRELHPGMGQAVAERTVLRKKPDGSVETWGDVADRVSMGNAMLAKNGEFTTERDRLRHHIARGTVLMSGRHLQHGDATQPDRNMEVFTNCSTAATSFAQFYLLMNGCFRKGTRVRLADGSLKAIELIQPGEVVLSFDERAGRPINKEVNYVHVNRPKPMVRVRMEDGNEVVCTFDHKFLTEDGWVEARHLAGKRIISAEEGIHANRAAQGSDCRSSERKEKDSRAQA